MKKLRLACQLEAAAPCESGMVSAAALGLGQDDESNETTAGPADEIPMEAISEYYINAMIDKGWDTMHKSAFLSIPAIPPTMNPLRWSRETVWKKLCGSSFWRVHRKKTRRAIVDSLMPNVQMDGSLADIYAFARPCAGQTFPEQHDVDGLRHFLHGHPGRKANEDLVVNALRRSIASPATRRLSVEREGEVSEVQKCINRRVKAEADADVLLRSYRLSEQRQAKRQRAAENDAIPLQNIRYARDKMLGITVSYGRARPWRSRRLAEHAAAQRRGTTPASANAARMLARPHMRWGH